MKTTNGKGFGWVLKAPDKKLAYRWQVTSYCHALPTDLPKTSCIFYADKEYGKDYED